MAIILPHPQQAFGWQDVELSEMQLMCECPRSPAGIGERIRLRTCHHAHERRAPCLLFSKGSEHYTPSPDARQFIQPRQCCSRPRCKTGTFLRHRHSVRPPRPSEHTYWFPNQEHSRNERTVVGFPRPRSSRTAFTRALESLAFGERGLQLPILEAFTPICFHMQCPT